MSLKRILSFQSSRSPFVSGAVVSVGALVGGAVGFWLKWKVDGWLQGRRGEGWEEEDRLKKLKLIEKELAMLEERAARRKAQHGEKVD
jgi:hypothetical protein